MTIIYSPEFNSTSFINLASRQQLLGLKICGSMELLSELELRAGIVAQEKSEPERLVAFHESLSKNVKGTIFEQSFKTDEVGVARQLMAWCDNLLMAGWTPDVSVESDKLKALAKFAKGVSGKHVAQRWQQLSCYLDDHAILQKDDVLEVHTKELIPAVIKPVIEKLARQATVNYVEIQGEMPTDFSVYRFKTRTDAYRWYLSQPEALKGVNVTISSDNCVLNDMALAMGRPVVNSQSQNSNPQLLQLFKLGLSLFERPLNVYNLLSYLQVPGNPLGGVSYQLARVLTEEGGLNEKWKQTIDDYDFTDDEGKDKRDAKLAFIEMIDKDYSRDKILVADVSNYTGKLAHWCDQLIRSPHVEDERKDQLVALASFCRSLQTILPKDGYISSEALKAHVDGIYRPQSFTHMKAQKDSPDVISDVTQLADKADKVCWLGCVGASVRPYPFDFLNQKECDSLNAADVVIPAKTEFYTLHHQLQKDALKNAGSLVLVTWEFDGNSRQEEHPLVAELKQLHKKDWGRHFHENEKPNLDTVTGDISTLEPQPSYQLSESLNRLHREEESYSSVSSLIQFPFDYTMQYLLKLREPQVGQLPDLDTTKGNVAHLFVEMLVKEYGENLVTSYRGLEKSDIQQFINEAISQKGAILLLPEYRLERQQFEAILQDSVSALVNIIDTLQLTPVGCEVERKVSLPTIGAFQAKIDLLLKDAHGDYVIFDMKWTESNRHKELLEQNKAMQLELYRRALEQENGTKVAGVAYYLFPKMTLYTIDFPTSDHIRQVKVQTEAAERDLFVEVQNSYDYRRDELNRGFIEECELTEIAELAYTEAADNKPLYPIDVAYNTKGLKSCPYVKKDKPPFAKQETNWDTPTDPKEIKTTHPILKGRLV